MRNSGTMWHGDGWPNASPPKRHWRSSPPPRGCRRCCASWQSAWSSGSAKTPCRPGGGRRPCPAAARPPPRGWAARGAGPQPPPPPWACRGGLPVVATLGDLHDVIHVLFGWDGDHLHVFQAGKKRHSDPLMDLDGTRNEEAIGLRNAMARNDGKISYTYDLGACWEHEITLEQTLPRDRGQDYPFCLAYKGDSPVEYWCEDDPEEPDRVDLAEGNRKLASL